MELRKLIQDLYGIDQPQGCTDEEIAAMKEIFGAVPPALENFYRTLGHTGELRVNQESFAALTEVMEGLGEPI